MALRYNSPPNWPQPPAGWTPPPGWRPLAAWGPAPPGWQFWVEGPPPPLPSQAAQSQSTNGYAMVAVAATSFGLAGFVPPLWAAKQRPDDAEFRRRMYAASAGLFALMVSALGLIAVANEDSSGSPTGLVGDLGGALIIINLLLAVTVAALLRNTRPDGGPPGVAEERARRRLREQYRRLAQDDPYLASSMRIGRPDLPRTVDDGGLLDINAIPAECLGPCAGLPAEEARRVVDARRQAGPFTSVDELAVYADLPEHTAIMLRERAIFFR